MTARIWQEFADITGSTGQATAETERRRIIRPARRERVVRKPVSSPDGGEMPESRSFPDLPSSPALQGELATVVADAPPEPRG